MKQLQNFFLRAICAIAAGVMLLRYSDQAITWFTIACGTLFFVSGLISCAFYLGQRSKKQQEPLYDMEGNPLKERGPMFPLVGIGSIVLGAILVFMRASFMQWGTYVLAAMLVLGAINQYLVLARARKYYTIATFYWIVATAILLIGLLMIAKPELLYEYKLHVIAWSMIVYGTTEIIIGVNSYRARRRIEREVKAQLQMQQEMQAQEVEDAEAEEITDTAEETTEEDHVEDAIIVDDASDDKPEEEQTIHF